MPNLGLHDQVLAADGWLPLHRVGQLRPIWDRLVGTELYEHDPAASEMCNRAENSCFDDFENVNLATSRPAVVSRLSKLLHEIVANYSYSNAFPSNNV